MNFEIESHPTRQYRETQYVSLDHRALRDVGDGNALRRFSVDTLPEKLGLKGKFLILKIALYTNPNPARHSLFSEVLVSASSAPLAHDMVMFWFCCWPISRLLRV